MRRVLPLALTAVACQSGSRSFEPDAGFPFRLPPAPDALPEMCGETLATTPADLHPADVLLLFDRSGSMVTEFGTGSRFSVEATLLDRMVGRYDAHVRFGFQAFPARGVCPAGQSPGCCVERPGIEVADSDGDAVRAAIAGAEPVDGNTPTAGALRLAREYFSTLDDGVADRYVLLSTDGRPSCGADGRLGAERFDADGARAAGPCRDALAEVDALVAAGVELIVLGVGPGLDQDPDGGPSCLEEMAARGRAPRPGAPPSFYPATDPAQLETALQQIFGGVARPSCTFELKDAPADPDRVIVLVDGVAIPRGREHGWDWDAPPDTTGKLRRLRLYGAYCERLEHFQIATVEARYGCRPCPEGMICE